MWLRIGYGNALWRYPRLLGLGGGSRKLWGGEGKWDNLVWTTYPCSVLWFVCWRSVIGTTDQTSPVLLLLGCLFYRGKECFWTVLDNWEYLVAWCTFTTATLEECCARHRTWSPGAGMKGHERQSVVVNSAEKDARCCTFITTGPRVFKNWNVQDHHRVENMRKKNSTPLFFVCLLALVRSLMMGKKREKSPDDRAGACSLKCFWKGAQQVGIFRPLVHIRNSGRGVCLAFTKYLLLKMMCTVISNQYHIIEGVNPGRKGPQTLKCCTFITTIPGCKRKILDMQALAC